jgi:hypothetical protein
MDGLLRQAVSRSAGIPCIRAVLPRRPKRRPRLAGGEQDPAPLSGAGRAPAAQRAQGPRGAPGRGCEPVGARRAQSPSAGDGHRHPLFIHSRMTRALWILNRPPEVLGADLPFPSGILAILAVAEVGLLTSSESLLRSRPQVRILLGALGKTWKQAGISHRAGGSGPGYLGQIWDSRWRAMPEIGRSEGIPPPPG